VGSRAARNPLPSINSETFGNRSEAQAFGLKSAKYAAGGPQAGEQNSSFGNATSIASQIEEAGDVPPELDDRQGYGESIQTESLQEGPLMDYENQDSQDYEEPEDIQDEQEPEIQLEEEDDSEEDLPMFGSQPRKKERREDDRSVGSPEKSRRSFSKSQRMSRSKSPEAPVLAKI